MGSYLQKKPTEKDKNKKGLNLVKNWMLYCIFGQKSEKFSLKIVLRGDFGFHNV